MGAYRHNLQTLRAAVAPAALMAVVKANAYGHGLVPIAKAAVSQHAAWLGVATAEEGIELRKSGLRAPILVLGAVNLSGAHACVRHGLTMTVADRGAVEVAQQTAATAGLQADVHLKLDTGMGRIGVRTKAELQSCLNALASSPGVTLTGVFTHLADADNADPSFTDLQLRRFNELRVLLPPGLLTHAAASAAALTRPDARFQMVRFGIASYGYPNVPTALDVRPCLTWTAEVVFVKQIEAGDAVGYGYTFRAIQTTRVATLAVGYGDGYPRALSGKADVLLHGKRCPIIGRVCMDQMMVDVTDAPETQVGDDAVLLGNQGAETIGADELAAKLQTIPYEVLLLPKARVPMIYDEE